MCKLAKDYNFVKVNRNFELKKSAEVVSIIQTLDKHLNLCVTQCSLDTLSK